MDRQNQELYDRVAQQLAARYETIFTSEETLKEAFEARIKYAPFDRTERWNMILDGELELAWHDHGIPGRIQLYDRLQIIHRLGSLLDYNLFTQVLLNLQLPLAEYRIMDAQIERDRLKQKWAERSPSPFDAKARMVKAATKPEELAFNRDLSALKALNIVSKNMLFNSYRVSPKGATPALADENNLSMLGIGGDQYLCPREGFRAFYFCWDQAPNILRQEDDVFWAEGISYPFRSKSGGEILNASLYARRWAATLYRAYGLDEKTAVYPRLNSVLLVTTASAERIADIVCPVGMSMYPDCRPDPELQPA